MRQKLIIAIDGYSSCGKSTLAKQLAAALQYVHVDSGAMYRAIALYFLRNGINFKKEKEITEALKNIHLSFLFNNASGESDIYLNDENAEVPIRDMLISEKVSEVATIKKVRTFAVEQQRKMGKEKGIVMDGRDIGTTVFPHAELKIFMTADIAVRVERRFKELYQTNKNITIEEVRDNLEMRDYIDSHRDISPLRKADDAYILDNSNLTMAQQLKIALTWAHEKISAQKNVSAEREKVK
jgi:cytidylate kinase